MPVYEYSALNGKGKTLTGIVDADGACGIKALDHGKTRFLEDYVCAVTGKNRGLHHCEAADWDRAIKALGARLRRAERLAAEKEAGR